MSDSSVKGLKKLDAKLNQLQAQTAAKALVQSVRLSLTPLVQEARIRIPWSDRAHRTYKGTLVAPGFASRSIKKSAKLVGGVARGVVGVKREAFYATQFVELGTDKIDAQPWLVPAFKARRVDIEKKFTKDLKRKIDKLTT